MSDTRYFLNILQSAPSLYLLLEHVNGPSLKIEIERKVSVAITLLEVKNSYEEALDLIKVKKSMQICRVNPRKIRRQKTYLHLIL